MQSKKIHYPFAQEISYKVALLKFVYLIENNINKIIIPIVKNMPNTFNKDSLYEIHCDDFLDELDIALQEIRELIAPYRNLFIAQLPNRFTNLLNFTTKQVVESLRGVVDVKVGNINPDDLLNISPVDLGVNVFNNSFRPSLQQLVKSSTLTNSKLITSIEDKLLDDVAIIIQEGYSNGSSAKTLTKQIKDKFGVTENRARLIARDQIGKLHSDVVRDEHLTIGVTEYKWLTSNDERVRHSHKVLNEKICSWNDPTVYKNSVNDKKWKKRSSIKAVEKQVGQDYQCRCDAIAIFK